MCFSFGLKSERLCSPLADPGGGGVPGGPVPPRPPDLGAQLIHFGGQSVQFMSKLMNFRALIFFFSKKFSSLASLSIILYFFQILLVSVHYFIFIFLCTYFYIIMTAAISIIVCKDWSKVFLHKLLHKNINLFMQNYFEMSTKSACDIRKIHILKWKMQQLLGPQMAPDPWFTD